MRKFSSLLIICLTITLISGDLIAGGLVTNTNQSASFIRQPARDATLDLDAIYYNPAGTAFWDEGFFFSLNNQSIFQKETISNDYKYLNSKDFDGKASAPLFPGVYAGYKMGNFAFSLGFNPIGGGGSAEYAKGLPSFHIPIADLVPGLGGPQNATYSTDIYFKGTSVYYGIQGGVSYKIQDWISAFLGARYNIASNKYEGYLKNTSITTKAPLPYSGRADQYMLGAQAQYKAAKEQFAKAGLADSAKKYGTLEAQMGIKATLLGDQEAEVEQTGSGITPIIGLDFSLLDKTLNIGVKYEMNTALVLKNKTTKDVKTGYDVTTNNYITQFPDGKEINSDIPALLSIGASYKATKDLNVNAGFHYYFDKNANWDGMEKMIDNNMIELAFGFEYSLTNDLLLSLGYLYTKPGVSEDYQSDLNYSLTTNTICLGGKYKLMNNLDLNLGFMYTKYSEGTKATTHDYSGGLLPSSMWPSANYTFNKSNYIIGIGFDYRLFSK